jgi:nicotinamide phosphoribosyltransferase
MNEVNYKLAAEVAFFKEYVSKVYPSGVASYVSDTYNFWDVITHIASKAKEEILARKPNAIGLAKVVFRPDSGDPADILCGESIETVEDLDDAIDVLTERTANEAGHGECGESEPSAIFRFSDGKYYKVSTKIEWNRFDKQYYYYDGHYDDKAEEVQLTPSQKGAVECLWDIFGGTMTETGHKMLDSHVGLIYGDSITLDRANDIMRRLEAKGFASGNVVFGIGSYTYQYVTRDTHGIAIKSTYGIINCQAVEIFKDPVTDNGVKKSATGLLKVIKDANGEFVLLDKVSAFEEAEDDNQLKTLFANGTLINKPSLLGMRALIDEYVKKNG